MDNRSWQKRQDAIRQHEDQIVAFLKWKKQNEGELTEILAEHPDFEDDLFNAFVAGCERILPQPIPAEQEAGEREQERLDKIAEEIKEDTLKNPSEFAEAICDLVNYNSDDSEKFYKALADLTIVKSQSSFNSAAADISDILNKHLDYYCQKLAEYQRGNSDDDYEDRDWRDYPEDDLYD